MKRSTLRSIVPAVLAKRGFVTRPKGGQGVLPGSRLAVKSRSGQGYDYAVRASDQRNVSFTRLPDGKWRTLSTADCVVAVVPALEKGVDFDVLAFKAKSLIRKFDEAWRALEKAGRTLGPRMPIFVPIDKTSRKNLGHDVANLRELVVWKESFTRNEILGMTIDDNFYERVRQEFADRNGVDVTKVDIEFRLRS